MSASPKVKQPTPEERLQRIRVALHSPECTLEWDDVAWLVADYATLRHWAEKIAESLGMGAAPSRGEVERKQQTEGDTP